MCIFHSCIINSKGRIYDKLGIDSHERLEKVFNLRDNGIHDRAKIEVISNKIWDKVEDWKFILDENRTPSWWNDGYKALVIDHIKKNVKPKCWDGDEKGNGKYWSWYENGQIAGETTYKGVYEQ